MRGGKKITRRLRKRVRQMRGGRGDTFRTSRTTPF